MSELRGNVVLLVQKKFNYRYLRRYLKKKDNKEVEEAF